MRELFSSSVTYGEDGALSSVAIKQRLRVMIQSEDPSHPMSDEELAAALANDHIEISRRTVAKYRSQLPHAGPAHETGSGTELIVLR